MPIQRIKDKTDQLKSEYNTKIQLSGFQRFFFPRALRAVLESEQSTPLEIADAAFKSTWFFHRWFFPSLFNDFFDSSIIKASEWLFKPTAITTDKVGTPIEQNLDRIEKSFENDPDLVNAISEFSAFYNNLSPAFFKWFFPSALKEVLNNKNQHNPIVTLIRAANKSTFFFHKFLFPKTFKNFFEKTAHAKKTIDDLTIPQGIARVERNITTLKELVTEKNPTSDLDEIVASIISSLNQPITNNYNAQLMFEKFRKIESKQDKDTLRIAAHALFVYFKDNPQNDPARFNQIVEAFETRETTEIYSLLQDTPLLSKTDETARKNIYHEEINKKDGKDNTLTSGIIAIKDRSFAFEILTLLKNKELLSDRDSAQENFDIITTYDDLPSLKNAVEILANENKLNQETFKKISVKGSPSIDLAKRLLEPDVVVPSKIVPNNTQSPSATKITQQEKPNPNNMAKSMPELLYGALAGAGWNLAQYVGSTLAEQRAKWASPKERPPVTGRDTANHHTEESDVSTGQTNNRR